MKIYSLHFYLLEFLPLIVSPTILCNKCINVLFYYLQNETWIYDNYTVQMWQTYSISYISNIVLTLARRTENWYLWSPCVEVRFRCALNMFRVKHPRRFASYIIPMLTCFHHHPGWNAFLTFYILSTIYERPCKKELWLQLLWLRTCAQWTGIPVPRFLISIAHH